jgi:hypothetical protein
MRRLSRDSLLADLLVRVDMAAKSPAPILRISASPRVARFLIAAGATEAQGPVEGQDEIQVSATHMMHWDRPIRLIRFLADIYDWMGRVVKGRVHNMSTGAPRIQGSPNYGAYARLLASASLVVVMAGLIWIAWQHNGVDLSATAPAAVAAILGAAINPPSPNSGLPPWAPGMRVWIGLIALALISSLATGVAVLLGSSHPGAAGAFVACVGGLAGLLYDTSAWTVTGRLARLSQMAAAVAEPAQNGPGVAATGNAEAVAAKAAPE